MSAVWLMWALLSTIVCAGVVIFCLALWIMRERKRSYINFTRRRRDRVLGVSSHGRDQ